MPAEPARHLYIVDDAGEAHPLTDCPHCKVKDDEIKGLQRDIRGWAARYAELERDREEEARGSKHWPVALELFGVWQEATGHSRSEWTADRFWMVEPFLRRKKYGPERCLGAIAGIAFDHFIGTRRNGSKIHYDEWGRVFKDSDHLERFWNAKPADWREREPYARVLAGWADRKAGPGAPS